MAKPKEYYCKDCQCRFAIHSRHKQGMTVNCPMCADWLGVERCYQNRQVSWSDEETMMIDKVIAKQMSVYEVMKITGRTRTSIWRKAQRRRKELNES